MQTERMILVDQSVSGIKGVCRVCRSKRHLRFNPFRNRLPMKKQIEYIGECGLYRVDRHDYVMHGEIQAGHKCEGSNTIPIELVNES